MHVCRRVLPLVLLALVGCGKSTPGPTTSTDTGTSLEGGLAGHRVAASADLTGDGLPDLVVSAPSGDGSGLVGIFDGSLTGERGPADAAATITADGPGDIGDGLQACGDLDGDGAGDLAIGLPRGNGGRGGVWLLNGPLTGSIPASTGLLLRGNDTDAEAGFTVDCRGDFDADGRADVLFSAPQADGFGIAEHVGQVFFHKSIDGGTDLVATFTSTYGFSEIGLHRSLILDEDLDGDGLDDAVMGAHGSARFYVLLAPYAGTYDPNYAGQTWDGRADLDSTGFSLAVGDLNGDGSPDVAVGAPRHEAQLGAVGVVPGPFAGLAGGNVSDIGWWVDGQDPKEYAGFALDIANDLDGDGNADLLVGAPGATTVGSDAGVVYLVLGPGDVGSLANADAVVLGAEAGGRFGESVASVPDVNGDGLNDVFVGAPARSGGAGGAFLFHTPLTGQIEQSAADTSFLF